MLWGTVILVFGGFLFEVVVMEEVGLFKSGFGLGRREPMGFN